MKKQTYLLILLLVFYYIGCTPGPGIPYEVKVPILYYDIPVEFSSDSLMEKSFVDCSVGLSGVKIFLDPGHGGEDRKNRGPKGIAIEADVNLKVSLYLREFLQNAGAIVYMSRDKDATVSLKERSEMANRSGADIFISVHHNAPGRAGDNWTNYTSTYYHAFESDFEYEPMQRDLARYIQRDLAYAMRNSGGLGSFDGTYSDYMIYPKSGFAVLRNTTIPAVLLECGFHTHRWEEERLAIDEFNKIQAWGIFRGLCKYFRAGVPKVRFVEQIKQNNDVRLKFLIEDKGSIDPKSIQVYVDSLVYERYSFDTKKSELEIVIPSPKSGKSEKAIIRVIAKNKNGNHSFPFHYETILNKE